MRIFQNSGISQSYAKRFARIAKSETSFAGRRDAFLADRYGASHILKPIQDGAPDSFFTNGDDVVLQRTWARENGLSDKASLDDILLAQIEEHRTDVFYNLDPIRYPSTFVRRLPGTVRRSMCWRAAPSEDVDFGGYDKILCNFPSIRGSYRRNGWTSAEFFPAHDPELDASASNTDRPVDIIFVGGYSQYHQTREALLRSVAGQAGRLNIIYHLDRSRMTLLAETPLGLVGPLRHRRRPSAIRRVSQPPVFGRTYYTALSKAKIVLNGAIDMAGPDRGNMRCWEAMGSGALLLSDKGNYPPGMVDDETMVIYDTVDDALAKLDDLIDNAPKIERISRAGHDMIRTLFSKSKQLAAFKALLDD